MAKPTNSQSDQTSDRRFSWAARALFVAIPIVAVLTIWVTNVLLMERFTETTRNRAEVRQALYSGNIMSELQRNSVVPLLLSRDPMLSRALTSKDFTQSSQRLISYRDEIGAAGLLLLDADGRTVAATDRNKIGETHRNAPYFVEALRASETVFTATEGESAAFDFIYSRRVQFDRQTVGVIVVEVDLRKFERAWATIADAVIVTDSEGQIILTTEPSWRGLGVEEALDVTSAPSAILRALYSTGDWGALPPDTYIQGQAAMRLDGRVPFQGWRITSFTTFTSVREQVNAVLALQIMGFAILLALTFYFVSRRAQLRSRALQQESAELRALNQRLQREIAEREKMQKSLAVAEQTLAQSSKLAALGEMSAAVSHELNQPLAAMKTYLAGAQLLLQRKRPDEAMSSFQRIDDLIERMGAITKQLKSYARKGGEAFEPLDARSALSSALEMMEPQLKSRKVIITRHIAKDPVMVMADRVRLEQVIINLIRNALDATKDKDDPQIELMLSAGETAILSVRDNGHGIADLDQLFDPFYTTKGPGEGVGLGLAISSGIVNDLGGRLTAHNAESGGAVFEIQLPIHETSAQAAE